MEQRKKKEKKKKKKSQVIRITPDVQIFLNNCGTIVNEDRNETNWKEDNESEVKN